MQFNLIPTDAPEFLSDKARYKGVYHKGTWRKDKDHMDTRTRWYEFKIGRSDKKYLLYDKYTDDRALRLLEDTKRQKQRLVIKGYLSPQGATMFVVLTHFGVYHRTRAANPLGYDVYNPETGNVGYYQLAEWKD